MSEVFSTSPFLRDFVCQRFSMAQMRRCTGLDFHHPADGEFLYDVAYNDCLLHYTVAYIIIQRYVLAICPPEQRATNRRLIDAMQTFEGHIQRASNAARAYADARTDASSSSVGPQPFDLFESYRHLQDMCWMLLENRRSNDNCGPRYILNEDRDP